MKNPSVRKHTHKKRKENKMKKTETKVEEAKLAEAQKKEEKIAESICNDKNCPIHGKLKTRGRVFEGRVIRKFHKRIVIEFERIIYVRKYERYFKSKTKIHARLPICMENDINVGDSVKVQECRPLSKMIHFVVIEKVNGRKK